MTKSKAGHSIEFHRNLIAGFFDFLNRDRFSLYRSVIAQDCAFEDFVDGKGWKGHIPLLQLSEVYKAFVPDLHFEVDQLIAEDKTVVARWTARGKYTGYFLRKEPGLNSIKFSGISIFTFKNEQVVSVRGNWSAPDFCAQVGISVAELVRGFKSKDQIVLRRSGPKASPIVLMPSYFIPGFIQWGEAFDLIRKKRNVITHDFIANRYAFERVAPKRTYGVKTESESLERSLKEAGCNKKIHLVGYSLGGVAALDYALRFPQNLSSLTLIEPNSPGVFESLKASGPVVQDFFKIALAISSQKVTDGNVSQMMVDTYRHHKIVPPSLPDSDMTSRSKWREMILYGRSIQSFRIKALNLKFDRKKISKFKVPVLFVQGNVTDPYYPTIMEELERLLPDSRRIIQPGYHGPHLFELERFVRAYYKFLDEIE